MRKKRPVTRFHKRKHRVRDNRDVFRQSTRINRVTTARDIGAIGADPQRSALLIDEGYFKLRKDLLQKNGSIEFEGVKYPIVDLASSFQVTINWWPQATKSVMAELVSQDPNFDRNHEKFVAPFRDIDPTIVETEGKPSERKPSARGIAEWWQKLSKAVTYLVTAHDYRDLITLDDIISQTAKDISEKLPDVPSLPDPSDIGRAIKNALMIAAGIAGAAGAYTLIRRK